MIETPSMLSERTQTKEIHLYKIPEYANSSTGRESRSLVAWGTEWGVVGWGGVEWEGWITKQQLDTWERDGYIYPLDCNDGFVSIYMSMCIKSYNFTMRSLLYVDKTSVLKNGYETVEAAG